MPSRSPDRLAVPGQRHGIRRDSLRRRSSIGSTCDARHPRRGRRNCLTTRAPSAVPLCCVDRDRSRSRQRLRHALRAGGGPHLPGTNQRSRTSGSTVSASQWTVGSGESHHRGSGRGRTTRSEPSGDALHASLLSDDSALMVQQARDALARADDQLRQVWPVSRRCDDEVEALANTLHAPLIGETQSHRAIISAKDAKGFGLPVREGDSAEPHGKRSGVYGRSTRCSIQIEYTRVGMPRSSFRAPPSNNLTY